MPNNYIYLTLKTGSTLRTPSPRRRQVSWDNMFFSDMDGDGSYKTFNGHKTSVLYASFCPKGDEVVSSSSDGFVKVISALCALCRYLISFGFDILLKDVTVYLIHRITDLFYYCIFKGTLYQKCFE